MSGTTTRVVALAACTASSASDIRPESIRWPRAWNVATIDLLTGRSLLLPRPMAKAEIKTPFQTVRAVFPHTAYRWSLGYAALCGLRVLNGATQAMESEVVEVVASLAVRRFPR